MTDKRKQTYALEPKGTEFDYGGLCDIVGNGQTILGLQMDSKVFIIIYDAELGKPNVLPKRIFGQELCKE